MIPGTPKMPYFGHFGGPEWESPHKTVKWEAENTILCETVLFQIEYRDIAKNRPIEKLVLCETVL